MPEILAASQTCHQHLSSPKSVTKVEAKTDCFIRDNRWYLHAITQTKSLNCNLIFERYQCWTWPNVTAGQITEVGQIIRLKSWVNFS